MAQIIELIKNNDTIRVTADQARVIYTEDAGWKRTPAQKEKDKAAEKASAQPKTDSK